MYYYLLENLVQNKFRVPKNKLRRGFDATLAVRNDGRL